MILVRRWSFMGLGRLLGSMVCGWTFEVQQGRHTVTKIMACGLLVGAGSHGFWTLRDGGVEARGFWSRKLSSWKIHRK